jgi:type I restriction enzyme S subunit
MSSEGWQQVAIGDLVDFAIGGGWGEEDDGETPVVVIRGTDIPAVRSGSLSTCPRRFEEKKKAEKRSLVEGDIVFEISGGSQKTGQSTGRPALITSELVDQASCTVIPASFCRLIRFKQERVLPSFMYYHLLNLHSSGRAADYEIQSTGISNFQFKEFLRVHPFSLPPLPEQRRIAWVLGTLDDKIELNRKMARTLEEAAAAIFKARFVDFEGVKEFEETDNGPIPKGWKVKTLGELSLKLTRGKQPSYIDEGGLLVLNQKCIRDGAVSFGQSRRHDTDARDMSDRTVQTGDVLINSTGVGTLGRISEVRWTPEPAAVDSHITLVRANSKEVAPAFLAGYLLSRRHEIEDLGHGSTGQTELARARLAEFRVIVPEPEAQAQYAKEHELMRNLVGNLERESATLAALRDELLPKLISGKIRVPEGVGPDLDQETATEVAEELAEA